MISVCVVGSATVGAVAGFVAEALDSYRQERKEKGLRDNSVPRHSSKSVSKKTNLTYDESLRVKEKCILHLSNGVENGRLKDSLDSTHEVRTKMQHQLLAGLQSNSLAASLDAVAWKQRLKQKVQANLAESVQYVFVLKKSRELEAESEAGPTVPNLPLKGNRKIKRCMPSNLTPTKYKRLTRSASPGTTKLQRPLRPSPGECLAESDHSIRTTDSFSTTDSDNHSMRTSTAESDHSFWPEKLAFEFYGKSEASQAWTSEDDTSIDLLTSPQDSPQLKSTIPQLKTSQANGRMGLAIAMFRWLVGQDSKV